jgi:hypothetical protein
MHVQPSASSVEVEGASMPLAKTGESPSGTGKTARLKEFFSKLTPNSLKKSKPDAEAQPPAVTATDAVASLPAAGIPLALGAGTSETREGDVATSAEATADAALMGMDPPTVGDTGTVCTLCTLHSIAPAHAKFAFFREACGSGCDAVMIQLCPHCFGVPTLQNGVTNTDIQQVVPCRNSFNL